MIVVTPHLDCLSSGNVYRDKGLDANYFCYYYSYYYQVHPTRDLAPKSLATRVCQSNGWCKVGRKHIFSSSFMWKKKPYFIPLLPLWSPLLLLLFALKPLLSRQIATYTLPAPNRPH